MKNNHRLLSTLLATGLVMLASTPASAAWEFEVAPYLWALNMNGQVGVGPITTTVNESFGDILSHLDWAAMVYGSAHNNDFGLYGNAMYARLSDTAGFGPSGGFKIKATENYGIFGLGASYIVSKFQFSHASSFTIEPYAGARFTLNNTSLQIGNLATLNDNQHWTDPVIGLNLKYVINKQWMLRLSGDIGGTSTNRQYSYSATGLIGYTPQSFWTNTTAMLGYHFLAQRYISGSGINFYEWNMRLFGPVIALSIRF